jgi:hypothetical protein
MPPPLPADAWAHVLAYGGPLGLAPGVLPAGGAPLVACARLQRAWRAFAGRALRVAWAPGARVRVAFPGRPWRGATLCRALDGAWSARLDDRACAHVFLPNARLRLRRA